ncbi:hypothetical protein TWF102_010397 [Orbilia oligospora]|uniref:EGF domain-specific O-linked N-acetylglucosamine transferase n=1 Tax=Orbilia oligospora TaxID=2813651 RepID=A0A7C8NAV5_ORBOL|nr:hypothetical protein TWF102_010397 [Orbilia oligospora]
MIRRPSSFLTIVIAVFVIFYLYYFANQFSTPSSLLPSSVTDASLQKKPPPPPPLGAQPDTDPKDRYITVTATVSSVTTKTAFSDSKADSNVQSVAPLPADYSPSDDDLDQDATWCETRYGPTYLQTIAKNARPFCKPESQSQFDCLHSNMYGESRKDSLCIAQNVVFEDLRFNIDCEFRNSHEPDLMGYPHPHNFQSYWYETGPRIIMTQFTNIGSEAAPSFEKHACSNPATPRDDGYKILIKREGGRNYWHSLMEILSFYFTIDALQMSINKKTGKPYMSPADTSKIQVIVLDKHDNKNYFELWNYFSPKPVLTLDEYVKDSSTKPCISNVIIPLPGASNPLWQGDWDPRICDNSIIVSTIRRRILKHLKISTARDLHSPINLTFIDRKGSRKLTNSKELTDALIAAYPKVNVKVVDMADLTLKEQISLVVNTDVLVGVHGAGHTHAFFLPPQSSLVEILPADLKHKGFRNLAGLRGIRYFSDHAPMAPSDRPDTSRDWHAEDVVFDKDAFMKLMEAAIQSVAHRGFLDSDVNRTQDVLL